ncbi:hypothetical protein CAT24_15835 [Acinetobacter pittii]|nr:hypothetical protein CAT24_15835 [Acinetobacter pittii]
MIIIRLFKLSHLMFEFALVDVSGTDIGFEVTETLIEKKIDTLFWEQFIYAQINTTQTMAKLTPYFS